MDKMEKMKKLQKAKGGLSDNEKKAKMGVISDMRDMAAKMMGEKLKGLKKVTVASDSPEGLKTGLEKAQELVQKDPMKSEDLLKADGEESEEYEAEEGPEMEASEEEQPQSIEEIDAKIQELMALKEQMKKEEA